MNIKNWVNIQLVIGIDPYPNPLRRITRIGQECPTTNTAWSGERIMNPKPKTSTTLEFDGSPIPRFYSNIRDIEICIITDLYTFVYGL